MSSFKNSAGVKLVKCRRCAGSGKLIKGLELDVCTHWKYEKQKSEYLNRLKSRHKNTLSKGFPPCSCCMGNGLVDPNHAEHCRQELQARIDSKDTQGAVKQHHVEFKKLTGRWPWEKKERG